MRSIALIAVSAALAVWPAFASAQPPSPGDRAGDGYQLVKSYETSMSRGEDSSASSQGHETLVERVLAVRPDGLELEYRYPEPKAEEERAPDWRFPARVFRPADGPLRLLNRTELEARLDAWLKKHKMPRTACGRWIFTWTAIQIGCDPQSALEIVEAFDLRSPELREGALHLEKEAISPVRLTLRSKGPGGSTFAASMEVDPEVIRRARAESDVIVGEITGKPVAFEAAAAKRAKESISGTISVALAADPAGRPTRRTKIVKLETKTDGIVQIDTVTETLERRPVNGPSGRR